MYYANFNFLTRLTISASIGIYNPKYFPLRRLFSTVLLSWPVSSLPLVILVPLLGLVWGKASHLCQPQAV